MPAEPGAVPALYPPPGGHRLLAAGGRPVDGQTGPLCGRLVGGGFPRPAPVPEKHGLHRRVPLCRLLGGQAEGLCLRGIGAVRRGAAVFGFDQYPCVRRYAGAGSGQDALCRGKGLGREAGGAEAVYLRPLRRGDPALLPGDGLHGGGGVLPGARGGGAL